MNNSASTETAKGSSTGAPRSLSIAMLGSGGSGVMTAGQQLLDAAGQAG